MDPSEWRGHRYSAGAWRLGQRLFDVACDGRYAFRDALFGERIEVDGFTRPSIDSPPSVLSVSFDTSVILMLNSWHPADGSDDLYREFLMLQLRRLTGAQNGPK